MGRNSEEGAGRRASRDMEEAHGLESPASPWVGVPATLPRRERRDRRPSQRRREANEAEAALEAILEARLGPPLSPPSLVSPVGIAEDRSSNAVAHLEVGIAGTSPVGIAGVNHELDQVEQCRAHAFWASALSLHQYRTTHPVACISLSFATACT